MTHTELDLRERRAIEDMLNMLKIALPLRDEHAEADLDRLFAQMSHDQFRVMRSNGLDTEHSERRAKSGHDYMERHRKELAMRHAQPDKEKATEREM